MLQRGKSTRIVPNWRTFPPINEPSSLSTMSEKGDGKLKRSYRSFDSLTKSIQTSVIVNLADKLNDHIKERNNAGHPNAAHQVWRRCLTEDSWNHSECSIWMVPHQLTSWHLCRMNRPGMLANSRPVQDESDKHPKSLRNVQQAKTTHGWWCLS